MARLIRLWGKKRGSRRSGSPMLGNVGEALFYAALLLLGTVSLASLIAIEIFTLGDQGPSLTRWGLVLMALVAVTFVLIGGGGVIGAALRMGTSAERRSALVKKSLEIDLLGDGRSMAKEFPNIPRDTDLTNSPGTQLAYRLPIVQSSTWKFLVTAAFWLGSSGLASVLVVWAIEGYQVNHVEFYRSVIAAPFVLIGIGATCYFVHLLLIHTALGPTTIEISDHPLYPGRSCRVFLSQAGHLFMNTLTLKVVCEEEATYQQGTNVRTETHSVYQQDLFQQQQFQIEPGVPFENECLVRIPIGAMHSFKSPSNAVYWKFVVQGDAAGWPLFKRCFPVIVHPAERTDS